MIELKKLEVLAGQHRLKNISLIIEPNAYVMLMGKTGSGKTTLLEAICGLRKIVSGSVVVAGQDVTNWSPGDRQIGYVPQDGVLFSNLNVRENLGFALQVQRKPNSYIDQRVTELSQMLGIDKLLDRSVAKLSGGEAQRVALGRALAASPKLLLLDEPLSALDEETRSEMYEVLRRVQSTTGVTTLHITHSLDEAVQLGDRCMRMDQDGIVEQTLQSARRVT
jgi:ABC-type sugar transport system ATPase subunit